MLCLEFIAGNPQFNQSSWAPKTSHVAAVSAIKNRNPTFAMA